MAVIAYHEAGRGDPFESSASEARYHYYYVSGTPRTVFDGTLSSLQGNPTNSIYSILAPLYDKAAAVPPELDISLVLESADRVRAEVTSGSNQKLSGTLHLALVERQRPFPWKTMEVVDFVCRAMLPNGNGQRMTLDPGARVVSSQQFAVEPDWNYCSIVAFFQGDDKHILQGALIPLENTIPEIGFKGETPAGVMWQRGSAHTISWASSRPLDSVQLEYSEDGGQNWKTLQAGKSGTDEYRWTLPETSSSQCLLAVRDPYGGARAVAGPFTIGYKGDFDTNGVVNDSDRNLLIDYLSENKALPLPGSDLNEDGVTDILDVIYFDTHSAPAQSPFTGTAGLALQITPANPSMADGQLEVRVTADLNTVNAAGGTPALSGFAIPIGFDASRLRLLSVAAGQAPGFSSSSFANTAPAVAQARGVVTLMNTRSGTAEPGPVVELARLIFEIKRPGKAVFLAGSDRTVHRGSLAATIAGSHQRIAWTGQMESPQITSAGTVPVLYCPSWVSKPGTFQGLAFLNEGPDDASVQISGWNADGDPVQAAEPLPLTALHQQAKVATELFGGSLNGERGWIEARSTGSDVTGFFMQGVSSATGLAEMDGAQMIHAPSSRIVFPLVGGDSGRVTEIWLVNPDGSPADAVIRLMNSGGSAVQTFPASVPAHGIFVRDFDETAGYVDVEATGGRLMGFERFGTSQALAVLNGQDGAFASNRLSGPQFASGYLGGNLRISTRVALVNPSEAPGRVILRLLNDQGREIAPPVIRNIGPNVQISSPGWELFGLADPSTSPQLAVGTLTVESDPGLVGALVFGDPVAGTYLAALPLMPTSAARREIFLGHVAVGLLGNIDYFTGVALFNPSATATAHVQLQLYDPNGTLVAETKVAYSLGPNSRTSQLVQQLIPDFKGSRSGGFVRVISDSDVYAYMLFGDTSYNFLSAVPVP